MEPFIGADDGKKATQEVNLQAFSIPCSDMLLLVWAHF